MEGRRRRCQPSRQNYNAKEDHLSSGYTSQLGEMSVCSNVRMVKDEIVGGEASPETNASTSRSMCDDGVDNIPMGRTTSTTASDHVELVTEQREATYGAEDEVHSANRLGGQDAYEPWLNNTREVSPPGDAGQTNADTNSNPTEPVSEETTQSLAHWESIHFPFGHTGFGVLDPRKSFPEGRVVGVYFDKQRRIWRANWREGGVGKRKTKNFSVDDYGFEEARRLAIQYRLLKIMEVSDKQLGSVTGREQAALLSAELKHKTERKSDSAKGKRRRRYTLVNHQLNKRSFFNNEITESYGRTPTVEAALPYEGWAGVASDEMMYLTQALHWQNGWGGIPVSGYPFVAGDFLQERIAWTPPPITVDVYDFNSVLDGISAADPNRVVTARPVSNNDVVFHQPTLIAGTSAENTAYDEDEEVFEGDRQIEVGSQSTVIETQSYTSPQNDAMLFDHPFTTSLWTVATPTARSIKSLTQTPSLLE